MRNRYVLVWDVLLLALAAFGAFALRFDLRFYLDRHEFLPYVTLALVAKLPIFYLFGLYGRVWRYATVKDLLAIATASLFSAVAMTFLLAAALWLSPSLQVSRAVVAIDALLTLLGLGAVRAADREARALQLFLGGHADLLCLLDRDQATALAK